MFCGLRRQQAGCQTQAGADAALAPAAAAAAEAEGGGVRFFSSTIAYRVVHDTLACSGYSQTEAEKRRGRRRSRSVRDFCCCFPKEDHPTSMLLN